MFIVSFDDLIIYYHILRVIYVLILGQQWWRDCCPAESSKHQFNKFNYYYRRSPAGYELWKIFSTPVLTMQTRWCSRISTQVINLNWGWRYSHHQPRMTDRILDWLYCGGRSWGAGIFVVTQCLAIYRYFNIICIITLHCRDHKFTPAQVVVIDFWASGDKNWSGAEV